MNPTLIELTRRHARLIGVELFADPALDPGISAITLTFEHGTLHAQANADDDTFAWCDAIASDYRKIAAPRVSNLWNEAAGKLLIWSYEMENQNGYFDGVQLHFDSPALDSDSIIQVTVAASMLHFYRLERIDHRKG